jgi:hypothetical protein
MKTSSKFVSAAFLVVGIAVATTTAAIAQDMQGRMGPGMMQGGTPSGATGSGMPRGGMSQDVMGPGLMQGNMGCPMMSAMMQDGTRQSMMGQGMMGRGMMGSGTTRGGAGGLFGTRVTPMMNLSVDDVRGYLGLQLERINNKRLKLGNVSADDGAISAEIVTVDNSLVQRLKVDRHTGAIEYEN